MIISKNNLTIMIEKLNEILNEYKYLEKDIRKVNSDLWFKILDKIISNINISDYYIEPNPNNIEKIKILRNSNLNKNITRSNIYLNDNYIEKNIKNIKKFSFISLYPTLIIKLIDNNIIKINRNDYYTIFKYLVNNRNYFKNKSSYVIVKIIINYFYGILVSKKQNKIILQNFEEFDNYKYHMYDNIKTILKDDLIYLDTDQFYYIDNNYNIDFNIPYEIEDVSSFKIYRPKKYIEVIDNIITHKGFR